MTKRYAFIGVLAVVLLMAAVVSTVTVNEAQADYPPGYGDVGYDHDWEMDWGSAEHGWHLLTWQGSNGEYCEPGDYWHHGTVYEYSGGGYVQTTTCDYGEAYWIYWGPNANHTH